MCSNYKQRLISLKPFSIFTEMFVHSLMSAIILRGTQQAGDRVGAGVTPHKCRRLHGSYEEIKDANLHPLSSSREVVSCRLT